jgi:chorismate mutase
MNQKKEIEHHRNEIDRIDRQLIELLNRRANHAITIGKIKKELHLPVYDPERETQIIEGLKNFNNGPLTPKAIERLFERIIDESRRIERDSAESRDGGV